MDLTTISAFIFSGLSLILCAWLIFSKQKLISKNKMSQNKLVLLEAKLLEVGNKLTTNQTQDKKVNSQKSNENLFSSNHNSELLQLRKEVAKYKDEIKKAKVEIKVKEKTIKEEENSTQNKLYILSEENTRLIIQMKEMDQLLKESNNSSKNYVPLIDFEKKILEISKIKEEMTYLKQKISEEDKFKKQNASKMQTLQEKLKYTENELQKWNDTAKMIDGKSLDPDTFMKWLERAISGRKMYRLMRQMRELSDIKVTTYQEGVVAVSQWVLEQKNMNIPAISSSEVAADRLLAEAWNAILLSKPDLNKDTFQSETTTLSN